MVGSYKADQIRSILASLGGGASRGRCEGSGIPVMKGPRGKRESSAQHPSSSETYVEHSKGNE